MGDLAFNITKGRVGEFVVRINANDPANSVLVWSLWNITQTDAQQRDQDDIAAIEAAGTNAELTSGTNANYVRKTLTDASGITRTVDDTNDWVDIDCPDQTWTALGAGTAINHALCAYDSDSAAGTDANQLPVSQHAVAITPDGSDVTVVMPVGGFYRSS
jgi:hypothetical protein